MKHQLIRIAGIFSILLLAAAAMAGTWSTNNFLYQPDMGARGDTERNTFDTGLNRVDAHLGQYKTLGDPGYSTLAEALTTIGSNNVTLTIPAGTVTIAGNTTIGNNIALRVFKGGKFSVNSGVTLTINGPVEAGPYQIFSGTGTVTLGGVSTIYDVWYAVPPSNPLGVIAAPIGCRFIKTSGSAPLVYVKESGTGTSGWVASSGGSGATAFTGLSDVPSSYSGQGSKALRVKSDASGLEFFTLPASGASVFTGLSDVPSSYTGQSGKSLRVNSNASGLEYYTPFSGAFTGLADAPGSYTGQGGKALRVKSDASGLEFFTLPASGATAFTGLSDVPSSYTGQIGKSLRVNSSGTGLEFFTPTSGGTTAFTGLTDVPSSYSGQAGKALRVNANSNGLEFYTPSSTGGIKPFITYGESGYATLSQALTTIGSAKTTMIIPAETGAVPITCNTTIPDNVDLRVFKGARFDVADGVTLTIKASIEAGPYQIFSWTGSGAINLKDSPTKRCYFQWWGAQPEAYWSSFNAYDNSALLSKAFASLGGNQEIYVTKGIWRCTSTVSVMDHYPPSLVGEHTKLSTLYFDVGASNDGLVIGHYNNHQVEGCWLKDISFASPANGCRHLLNFEFWNGYGGTQRVDLQGGSTDSIVRLATVENCNWDFNLGTNNGYYANNVGISNYVGQMKTGIVVEPATGAGNWGGGTYNTFRVLKTASLGGIQALKISQAWDIEIGQGDIENCSDGDVLTWMKGAWPWTDKTQLYSGATTKIAHTFTLSTSTDIKNTGIYFDRVGTPKGWVTASIYATSGGVPTGSPLMTSATKYSAGEMNVGNSFACVFDFNTTLPAGTYAVVGEYSGGDASNYVNINVDKTSGEDAPGTCYTYDGSWHAQTYNMRFAINVAPAVELNSCNKIKVKHQHFEANWLDLKLDHCQDMDLENISAGVVDIARSTNVKIGGSSCISTKLSIDPLSSVILGSNTFFPSSTNLKDYGNTQYNGGLQDWINRTPPNIKGNNPLNYHPNTLFDRWQPDRPDGWNKDSSQTWTKCGVGQTDTTRHLAPYCAKMVATSESNVNDNAFSPLLDFLRGNSVTLSMWVMFPAGQSWDSSHYLQISYGVPAWAGSTAYNIGEAVNSGYGTFICVQPGTSGSSAPNWQSVAANDYINDGTVRWIKDGSPGNISGGTMDTAWADGQWRRVSMTLYIPSNATSIGDGLKLRARSGGGSTTVYIAEPTITLGSLPPRGIMPGPGEFQNYLQASGNRLDWGTAAPTDGRWCNKGDVRFNANAAAAGTPGWVCTTAGPAGSTAVWKAMSNLAN